MILANLELIQTNDTLPEPNYKNLTKLYCTESRYTRCMYEIFSDKKDYIFVLGFKFEYNQCSVYFCTLFQRK